MTGVVAGGLWVDLGNDHIAGWIFSPFSIGNSSEMYRVHFPLPWFFGKNKIYVYSLEV